LFENDNSYIGAHYITSNIPIFLNAKFVCSVNKYQPPQPQSVETVFGQGEGQSQQTGDGASKHKI